MVKSLFQMKLFLGFRPLGPPPPFIGPQVYRPVIRCPIQGALRHPRPQTPIHQSPRPLTQSPSPRPLTQSASPRPTGLSPSGPGLLTGLRSPCPRPFRPCSPRFETSCKTFLLLIRVFTQLNLIKTQFLKSIALN